MPEKIVPILSDQEVLAQFDAPADRRGEDRGGASVQAVAFKSFLANAVQSTKIPTPNLNSVPASQSNIWVGRRGVIKSIVLHTMSGSYEGTNSWFQNPAASASTNFGVAQDGRAAMYVDPFGSNAPFANGYVCNPDAEAKGVIASIGGANLNYHTISIEHEDKRVPNTQITDFPSMFRGSTLITAWCCEKLGIDPNAPGALLGHYQIDGCNRSGCPGWSAKTWESYYAEVNRLFSSHIEEPPVTTTPPPTVIDPFSHAWTAELANIVARNGFTLNGKEYLGQEALEFLAKNGISLMGEILSLNEELLKIKKHLGLK